MQPQVIHDGDHYNMLGNNQKCIQNLGQKTLSEERPTKNGTGKRAVDKWTESILLRIGASGGPL